MFDYADSEVTIHSIIDVTSFVLFLNNSAVH